MMIAKGRKQLAVVPVLLQIISTMTGSNATETQEPVDETVVVVVTNKIH